MVAAFFILAPAAHGQTAPVYAAAPPTFGGHPGLQLLYAERLAGVGRPGWVPPSGPAREWVERVHSERGRPLPAAIPTLPEAPGD